MSEQGEEQDKSEEPTPFKLRKAREKGQVARGMDLGFAGGLVALAAGATIAGHGFVARMAAVMGATFSTGIDGRGDPNEALGIVRSVYWDAFQPMIVFGAIVAITLIVLELLQLRGIIFTTHPLKPDFKRLNPAQGLKRVFSLRMLKETLKNVLKLAAYSAVAWFVGVYVLSHWGVRLTDAASLAQAMEQSALSLIYAFIGLAIVVAAIDQIIVRGEFRKQMRMSRREMTRESKDREGEPRIKQKRKELHQQMRQQSENLGNVPGADMVIVNPQHYAVALKYDPREDAAPIVKAKGQDHMAQLIKRKAALHGVSIIANPPLARALFADCRPGAEIAARHYRDVAKHYRDLQAVRTLQTVSSSEVLNDR